MQCCAEGNQSLRSEQSMRTLLDLQTVLLCTCLAASPCSISLTVFQPTQPISSVQCRSGGSACSPAYASVPVRIFSQFQVYRLDRSHCHSHSVSGSGSLAVTFIVTHHASSSSVTALSPPVAKVSSKHSHRRCNKAVRRR